MPLPCLSTKANSSFKIRMKVASLCGHSSIPPPHTSTSLSDAGSIPLNSPLLHRNFSYKAADYRLTRTFDAWLDMHQPSVLEGIMLHTEHCKGALRIASQELLENHTFIRIVGAAHATSTNLMECAR
ncbi:hypothetical protein BDR03DRAFT_174748 [Suillus americanus]|nr:hypothetical protein BDR03DRAFT_174748 [Suillus americanus]